MQEDLSETTHALYSKRKYVNLWIFFFSLTLALYFTCIWIYEVVFTFSCMHKKKSWDIWKFAICRFYIFSRILNTKTILEVISVWSKFCGLYWMEYNRISYCIKLEQQIVMTVLSSKLLKRWCYNAFNNEITVLQ